MPSKQKNKSRRNTQRIVYLGFALLFCLLAIGFSLSMFFNSKNDSSADTTIEQVAEMQDTVKSKADTSYLKAIIPDTDDDYITISNFGGGRTIGEDELAGREEKYHYTGRRINIAIVGLDSRLGTSTKHADANHVVSVLLDSGKIEIISVPRDTPADAGLPDSTGQNKLTVVRAVRGREFYLEELARIARLDKIHFFVEVGFSQVVGFLDFLGYNDPHSTLQVLRSRKGLGGDDYQRCYNQANFIKLMILRHFDKIKEGLLSDVLIRGGLALITTNLNYSNVRYIVQRLEAKNFPRSSNDITIKIRPPVPIKFKIYDFSDPVVVTELINTIEHFNNKNSLNDTTGKIDVYRHLDRITRLAAQDTAKFPKRAIAHLDVYFEQRAWLQIPDEHEREEIRSRFENILVSSYNKLKQYSKANNVKETLNQERELFKHKSSL